jgi:hypothetical protein
MQATGHFILVVLQNPVPFMQKSGLISIAPFLQTSHSFAATSYHFIPCLFDNK